MVMLLLVVYLVLVFTFVAFKAFAEWCDTPVSERKLRRELEQQAWGERHDKMLDLAAIVVPTFAGFALVCALTIFFTI